MNHWVFIYMQNRTLYQSFHWYTPGDGKFWLNCRKSVDWWADLGFTHVWLPPAYKSGFGANEPGYAVYDLFDLGEFNQKGSVRTKYGTKAQYISCIKAMKKKGISAIADVVLNHRLGGDQTERFPVREVHYDNRVEFADDEKEIEAHTIYNFPGRNKKYSEFIWDWRTFTGLDEGSGDDKKIYKIMNGYGENWEDLLDDQFGNFDYLMGADVEFRNEHVRAELKWWGKWYYETTGVDGFRLDAVKHITPFFFMEWIDFMKEELKRDFFIMSEYWRRDVDFLIKYFESLEGRTMLVDAPLHYNFHEASMRGNDYDLRTIFEGSFLQYNPLASVTFVDNHDTQPLQALESPVDYWFKPLAYALILLREQGTPCVFNPCVSGAEYSDEKNGESYHIHLHGVPYLDRMLKARKDLSYGNQREYFDHANTVGWTREGIDEKPESGIAVLIANGSDGDKEMELGERNANTVFVDVTGNIDNRVATDEHGKGLFTVPAGSASVYIRESARHLLSA